MRWLTFPFAAYGRIDRKRFWGLIVLAVAIVVVPMGTMVAVIASTPGSDGDMPSSAAFDEILVALALLALTVSLASYLLVAAAARRFNDRGKSSWWVFLGFVPLLGPLWCFVELGCLPGTSGRHRYDGPSGVDASTMSAVFGEQPVAIVAGAGRTSSIFAVLAAWATTLLVLVASMFVQMSPMLRHL